MDHPTVPFPRLVLILVSLLFLASALPAQAVVYVKQDADGAGDGSSWDDAYPLIYSALYYHGSGTEIWVAAGTYQQGFKLTLPSNVALYGGFDGTETSREERDPKANETIISLQEIDDPYFYSIYCVIYISDNNVTLDGFTISEAHYAEYYFTEPEFWYGSGIYVEGASNVSIANCIIRDNTAAQGGGLYLVDASVSVSSCSIIDNSASYGGGAVYLSESSHINMDRCTISNNNIYYPFLGAYNGGGFYLDNSSSHLTNCIISKNYIETTGDGGGFYLLNSSMQIDNCIITQNYSTASRDGGAIYADNSSPILTNCNLFANSASRGGAIFATNASDPALNNVIFSSHPEKMIYEDTTDADVTLRNCLFFNNSNVLYYNADNESSYTYLPALEADAPEVTNSVEGDPLFAMGGDGSTFADFRIRAGSPAIGRRGRRPSA